jgi:hypothetical protein
MAIYHRLARYSAVRVSSITEQEVSVRQVAQITSPQVQFE